MGDNTQSSKIAPRKSEKRANKYGYWTGKYDLDSVPLPDRSDMPWYKRVISRIRFTRLYEFTNSITDPLTFHHPDGYMIRPDQHFVTDMGSIPKRLQGLIPWLFAKDLWLEAYIIHDSAYMDKALWFAKRPFSAFVKSSISKADADNLLALMIKASGGSCISSAPIWFGVWIGGAPSWNKGDARKKKEKVNVNNK